MDQHKNSKRFRKTVDLADYNAKKTVSFQKFVDIFQLSDAWQLHVKKSNLKTEEDQAKRRILQRNY